MGVASGCCCKEVYSFLHTTYPTPLVSVLFCSNIPTFSKFFIMFYIVPVLFCNKIMY